MSILWNPSEATSIITVPMPIITTGTQNMGNGVYLLKAGTPLDEDFAVSNDGDAKYLVAEDFFFYSNTPTQPKLVPIITGGYIDLNKAQEAAGITYAEAAVAALKEVGIVLVDGLLDTGSGGGSAEGAPLILHEDADTGRLDKTWQEIKDAISAGRLVTICYDSGALGVTTLVTTAVPGNEDEKYALCTDFDSNTDAYICDTADDYPVPW